MMFLIPYLLVVYFVFVLFLNDSNRYIKTMQLNEYKSLDKPKPLENGIMGKFLFLSIT